MLNKKKETDLANEFDVAFISFLFRNRTFLFQNVESQIKYLWKGNRTKKKSKY